MKFITIGHLYSYSFYPLYASAFSILRSYSFKFFGEAHKFKCTLLFEIFLMFTGMSLSIFLEIISAIRQFKNDPIKSYCKKLKDKWKYQFLIIFLALLDLSEFALLSIPFEGDKSEKSSSSLSTIRMMQFLFIGIMCYVFLKIKLHRHHIASFILIAIGYILVIYGKGDFSFELIYLLGFIGNLLYASVEVIHKWLMEYKFFSPFEIVYLSGLYGLILTGFICWIIQLSGNDSLSKYANGFGNNLSAMFSNGYFIIEIIIYLITTLGHNVLFLVTNKYLGPTYHIIIDATSSMVIMLLDIVITSTTKILIMQIPGYFLIVIGSLIYNEIIIINAGGMDNSTKTKIEQRASKNANGYQDILEDTIEEIEVNQSFQSLVE